MATGPAAASDSQVSSSAAASQPVEDDDDELDQLLSLQKPVVCVSENRPVTDAESVVPENGKCI